MWRVWEGTLVSMTWISHCRVHVVACEHPFHFVPRILEHNTPWLQCWLLRVHAEWPALWTELGRPEPAGALASVGAIDAAAQATVRTLECSTESPVVATLAAVWGPDIRPLARKTIGHLRSRRVALALHAQLKGYPDIAALLDTVIRAMANR